MATPNVNFYDLTVATLRNYTSAVSDNVSQHNALYRRLKDKNRIRTVTGGTTITENLDYAENQTVQNYSGYDVLNVNPSQVLTAAEYYWRQKAVNITYSGEEVRKNMGEKTRILNLVESRINNAFKSAANDMNRALYGTGIDVNAKPDIGGLQLVIADVNTNMVGGIDGNIWPFWRNKVWNAATSEGSPVTLTKDNILSYMNKMWTSLTRGTDYPDFIVASPEMYNMYEESQQQIQRYMKSDEAKAGFETLKYKTADVFFDQTQGPTGQAIMPASHMYFINTDYLKLCEHPDARWTRSDERMSVNQDATVIPLFWMGQLVCSNRFMQGVMLG